MKNTTKRPTMKLEVTVTVPAGCGEGDILDYTRDAVKGWAGGLLLEDPLSGMFRTKVTVKIIDK